MTSLQQLVESTPSLFADSVRESESTLLELEAALNVSLPSDVRWFWQFCGSGDTDAAPNARHCISDTIRYRSAVSLPSNYVVLDDRNDGGTVLLDTDSPAGAVIWVDYHAVERIGLGKLLPTEHDLFPAFTDWVSFCMEQASDAA
jgi:hypothetical protein